MNDDNAENYPLVECPSCGTMHTDADGFGVQFCEVCGYCTHPAADGDVCQLCGGIIKKDEPGTQQREIVTGTDGSVAIHENAASTGIVDVDQYTEQLIAYTGEIQLIENKWSDSAGYVTRLQMHEGDDGGHPLKRFHRGTRFHMVLVEVDDDERPIDQVLKQRIQNHLKSVEKGGKHSKEAGMLCKTRDFQVYLYKLGRIAANWDEKMRTEAARLYIYETVGIKSRRELDHDEHKAQAFRNLVVDPYFNFMRQHQRRQH